MIVFASASPLRDWEEFKRMIVFMKDGKLVYFEKDPTGIKHPNQ